MGILFVFLSMLKSLITTLLTMLYSCCCLAQQYTFVATAQPDTVAAGDEITINCTLNGDEEKMSVLYYGYGALQCTRLVQTGAKATSEEMTINNGKTVHSITNTLRFTATETGTVFIPRSCAVLHAGDTIWSNALQVHVEAGLKKELFPVLTQSKLFPQAKDRGQMDEVFLAEHGIEVRTGIDKAAERTRLPYLVNAGLLYHRTTEGGATTVQTINKLGNDIVHYMSSRKDAEPIGLFWESKEPRYAFAVRDTSGISSELDNIYTRYRPLVCTTRIAEKSKGGDIAGFALAHSIWQETDAYSGSLERTGEKAEELHELLFTINFTSDSTQHAYSRWAQQNDFAIRTAERKQRLEHNRFFTVVVYTITANALPETLFRLSALHHAECRALPNCNYSRMDIEKPTKK